MRKREVQALLGRNTSGGEVMYGIRYADGYWPDLDAFAKMVANDLGITEDGEYPLTISTTLGEEGSVMEKQICTEQMAQMICKVSGGEEQLVKLFLKLCGGKLSPSKGMIQMKSHVCSSTYIWRKDV